MQGTTKPISLEEINKIEMKNDGKDSERFGNLLRKVVTVPKKEIEAREKKSKTKEKPRKT